MIAAEDQQRLDFFGRAALAGAAATLFIGVLGILGWIFGLPFLTRIHPNFIPIASSTCIAFIVQGLVLIVYTCCPPRARNRLLVMPVAVTCIFGMLALIDGFAYSSVNFQGLIFAPDELFGSFPVKRMSPITGVLFCLSGTALILLLLHETVISARHLAGGLAGLVGMAGLIETISYTYGTPLLYNLRAIPMALTTSIAFLFLGTGLTAATGPVGFPLGWLTGRSVRATLLRTFVPLGFTAVVGSDLLRNRLFMWNSGLGLAVSAVIFGMLTVAFVALAARRIGGAMEKAEAERDRSEKAQIESERKFQTIFDHARDGMLLVDIQTQRFHLGNPAICEMLGYTWEELKGLRVKDIHPEQNLPLFMKHFEHQARGEADLAQDIPVRRKDGSLFHAEINAVSIELEGRKYLLGVFRDVSARMQTETALKQSEKRYRELADLLPQTVFEIDSEGRCTFSNRGAYAMFGYDPGEFEGRFDVLQLIAPEDRERAKENIRRRLSGEKFNGNKYTALRKDGAMLPIRIYSSPILDEERITGLRGIIVDMTAQVRVEDSLREAKDMLQALIYASPMGIDLIDRSGNVLLWNPAAERMFGWSERELIGKFPPVVPEDKKDEFLWFLESVFEGKSADSIDVRRCKKDGSPIYISISSAPVRDAAGNIIAAMGIYTDITDRKKAFEERNRLEDKLRQAQKMEAIGTLAGGIAHDFNNILGIILGYTELAAMDLPEESQAHECLTHVINAGHRAKELVQQILAFSRQSKQERKPVQIGPIVKEALKMLRATLPATIEIRQDIGSNGIALADPSEVHQILMNLCTNAYHAMKGSSGVLRVSLEDIDLGSAGVNIALDPDLKPGQYLRLTIADNGCGMTPDVLGRIFDPYFTTKPPGEGTGLGLAVVHGIVKSHGGAITVSSELGKGSSFEVYFPIAHASAESDHNKPSSNLPYGTERILFVDDEQALASLGSEMLERLGYRVTLRTSSIEALEAFRSKPDGFDLVVTDLTMPQMTGIELAQRIIDLRPDVPIILCTGFSEAPTMEKAEALGIRRRLMKPLVMNDIALAVRRVLDEGPGVSNKNEEKGEKERLGS